MHSATCNGGKTVGFSVLTGQIGLILDSEIGLTYWPDPLRMLRAGLSLSLNRLTWRIHETLRCLPLRILF